MKKMLTAAVAVAGVVFLGGAAFAQDDKTTEISFDGDRIEGEIGMPVLSTIKIDGPGESPSLVKAQEDFADAMRKTINEL